MSKDRFEVEEVDGDLLYRVGDYWVQQITGYYVKYRWRVLGHGWLTQHETFEEAVGKAVQENLK